MLLRLPRNSISPRSGLRQWMPSSDSAYPRRRAPSEGRAGQHHGVVPHAPASVRLAVHGVVGADAERLPRLVRHQHRLRVLDRQVHAQVHPPGCGDEALVDEELFAGTDVDRCHDWLRDSKVDCGFAWPNRLAAKHWGLCCDDFRSGAPGLGSPRSPEAFPVAENSFRPQPGSEPPAPSNSPGQPALRSVRKGTLSAVIMAQSPNPRQAGRRSICGIPPRFSRLEIMDPLPKTARRGSHRRRHQRPRATCFQPRQARRRGGPPAREAADRLGGDRALGGHRPPALLQRGARAHGAPQRRHLLPLRRRDRRRVRVRKLRLVVPGSRVRIRGVRAQHRDGAAARRRRARDHAGRAARYRAAHRGRRRAPLRLRARLRVRRPARPPPPRVRAPLHRPRGTAGNPHPGDRSAPVRGRGRRGRHRRGQRLHPDRRQRRRPLADRVASWAGVDLPLEVTREEEIIYDAAAAGGPPRLCFSDMPRRSTTGRTGSAACWSDAASPRSTSRSSRTGTTRRWTSLFIAETESRLLRRWPGFRSLVAVDSYTGLYDVTPDWHPVLGAVDGLEGFFMCAGSAARLQDRPRGRAK